MIYLMFNIWYFKIGDIFDVHIWYSITDIDQGESTGVAKNQNKKLLMWKIWVFKSMEEILRLPEIWDIANTKQTGQIRAILRERHCQY